MKKFISILALSAYAFNSVHAAADFLYNSFLENIQFTLSDGTGLSTVNDNYLITFWYSDTGLDDLKPIGVAGFYDGMEGFVYWQSNPISTTPFESVGYAGIKIFQLEDGDFADDAAWEAFSQSLMVDSLGDANSYTIADMWDQAYAKWASGSGGEIGEWSGGFTAGINGNTGDPFVGAFGFAENGVYQLTVPSVIPEPATYAAMAGLLALGLMFYRKKRS